MTYIDPLFFSRRTPLQYAAYGGYVNCMSILVENKPKPNIQDNEVTQTRLNIHLIQAQMFIFQSSK